MGAAPHTGPAVLRWLCRDLGNSEAMCRRPIVEPMLPAVLCRLCRDPGNLYMSATLWRADVGTSVAIRVFVGLCCNALQARFVRSSESAVRDGSAG